MTTKAERQTKKRGNRIARDLYKLMRRGRYEECGRMYVKVFGLDEPVITDLDSFNRLESGGDPIESISVDAILRAQRAIEQSRRRR